MKSRMSSMHWNLEIQKIKIDSFLIFLTRSKSIITELFYIFGFITDGHRTYIHKPV